MSKGWGFDAHGLGASAVHEHRSPGFDAAQQLTLTAFMSNSGESSALQELRFLLDEHPAELDAIGTAPKGKKAGCAMMLTTRWSEGCVWREAAAMSALRGQRKRCEDTTAEREEKRELNRWKEEEGGGLGNKLS